MRPYGRRFRYCTAGRTPGRVVQAAVGEPLQDYAQRACLAARDRRAGMQFRRWHAQTGGGLVLRSRDLLALASCTWTDGVHGGKRIVPAAWVAGLGGAHAKATDEMDYGYLGG